MKGISRHDEVLKYLKKYKTKYKKMPTVKTAMRDLKISSRGNLLRILEALVINKKLKELPKIEYVLRYKIIGK